MKIQRYVLPYEMLSAKLIEREIAPMIETLEKQILENWEYAETRARRHKWAAALIKSIVKSGTPIEEYDPLKKSISDMEKWKKKCGDLESQIKTLKSNIDLTRKENSKLENKLQRKDEEIEASKEKAKSEEKKTCPGGCDFFVAERDTNHAYLHCIRYNAEYKGVVCGRDKWLVSSVIPDRYNSILGKKEKFDKLDGTKNAEIFKSDFEMARKKNPLVVHHKKTNRQK